MKTMRVIVLALVMTFASAMVPNTSACPMCQEAAGSSSTGLDDAAKQARAFNRAIYLMVSMPYLLLGGLGFLFYRSVRKAKHTSSTTE